MIRTAVVTISDSVARGTREDRSGPALRQRAEQLGWQVAGIEVVEDDREAIAHLLADLSDRRSVSLILTTGGTGVAQRDVTPEATREVVEREIPGLAELMRAEGRRFTPRAVLSRGIAGTRGRTLIVNLPGSPKGAMESFDAVAELAPHIIDLLEGRTEHT
jgi:molybdopterin adenylyltransferase